MFLFLRQLKRPIRNGLRFRHLEGKLRFSILLLHSCFTYKLLPASSCLTKNVIRWLDWERKGFCLWWNWNSPAFFFRCFAECYHKTLPLSVTVKSNSSSALILRPPTLAFIVEGMHRSTIEFAMHWLFTSTIRLNLKIWQRHLRHVIVKLHF